ncbi:MAG: phosphatase PAP2 family protein [Prevotellaceae bacterium]|nr:phosphatase PAP2 family protein [Candidatus Minthosoma caballi]
MPLLSILILLIPLTLRAQEAVDSTYLAQIDSLVTAMQREQAVRNAITKFETKRLQRELQFNTDGFMPLMRGLMLTWTDHGFITHSGTLAPQSDAHNWRDYGVAGAPLAASWIMKAAGVKSRSTTQRMLTANAMAFAFSAGTTKLLKSTVKETRPDGTDEHSFPSGHTSFAFASATILAREYGYISPWISVGSYATATATQVLRVKHGKHWVSDIYSGAGIGMVSASLAYYLTDRIFGTKGIQTPPEVRRRDIQRVIQFNAQPSGFSFVSGTEAGSRTITIDGAPVKASASLTVGADLSFYLNPNIAVEVLARSTMGQAKAYNERVSDNADLREASFGAEHLQLYHFDAAAKYSIPVALDKRFSGRAIVGARQFDAITFTSADQAHQLRQPSRLDFECGLGLGYEAIDKENYAVGFSCDWLHAFSPLMKDRFNISTVWKILF